MGFMCAGGGEGHSSAFLLSAYLKLTCMHMYMQVHVHVYDFLELCVKSCIWNDTDTK